MDTLDTLRDRLDTIDREILARLRDRLDQVARIARLKASRPLLFRDGARETALLSGIEAQARALGLDPFRAAEIFREIIAMSVKVQEEELLRRRAAERSARNARRVAYQGAEGSYSALAARKYFAGDDIELAGFTSFALALREAELGHAGYAFLPIENTTAGSINETYDLLLHTALAVVGEEIWNVRHCLVGLPGATAAGLRRVISHPQALAQCNRFLASLADAEMVAFVDTADAVRKVGADGDPAQAAIASEEAARLHGLDVLARDIQDQSENWTRFVVVSSVEIVPDPRIPSKTSLVLVTPHRQGSLAHCLDILADKGLNLTKLESRPVPHRPWEYMFYLDFEGSLADEPAAAAVAALRAYCPSLKVLGSYPARTTPTGRVDRGPGSER